VEKIIVIVVLDDQRARVHQSGLEPGEALKWLDLARAYLQSQAIEVEVQRRLQAQTPAAPD